MIFLGYIMRTPSKAAFATVEEVKHERRIAQAIFGLSDKQAAYPNLLFKEPNFTLSLILDWFSLLEVYLENPK